MPPDQIAFYARSLAGGLAAAGAAFLTGRGGIRLLGLRCDSAWEEFSCSTAAGFGIIACGAFGLGIAGMLRPGVFAGVLAVLVVLSLLTKRPAGTGASRGGQDPLHRTAFIVVMVLSLPLLLLPLYPPTAPDAITYHLALARKFSTSGLVSPAPEFRYAVFPELAEMLFTGALLLGNDILAQWVSLIALGVTAASVAAFARRAGGDSAALMGGALVFSSSAMLLLGGTAYGDMLLAAFVTVALFSYERWRGGGGGAWLSLAGVMCGFAAGTKYSALFFPPVLLLMIARDAGIRRAVRPALVFLLSLAASALPWYTYIAADTGNPVWPFLSGIFGLKYWNGVDMAYQNADLLSNYGSGKSMWSLAALPWNLFAHPGLFHTDGTLSFVLALVFPFALYAAIRDRSARRLAFVAAAYTVFWFFTAQILRYLLPVVPVYCAVAASGIGQAFHRRLPRGIVQFVSAFLAIVLFIPAAYFVLHMEGTSGAPPSTPGERERYLQKTLPSYGAVRFLNERAGSAYTLYAHHDPQMAYFASGEFRGDYFGPWRYSRLDGVLAGAEGPLLDTLHSLGADYLLLRDDSTASSCREEWLTRRFVVPVYRSPAVVLFRVSDVPLVPSYGHDLTPSAGGAGGAVSGRSARFAVGEGKLYCCTCEGSAPSAFAAASLEITWFDARGAVIRKDEAPGVFLPQPSLLRLLATSPPRANAACVEVSPQGDAPPSVSALSVRELGFVPAPP